MPSPHLRGSAEVEGGIHVSNLHPSSPNTLHQRLPAIPNLKQNREGVRRHAYCESGLTGLPAECPWTIEQVLDKAFWPDSQ